MEQEKVSRSRVEEEKKRLETEASHAQKALRDLQKAGTRQDQMARSRGKMTCIGYVSGMCLMLQLHWSHSWCYISTLWLNFIPLWEWTWRHNGSLHAHQHFSGVFFVCLVFFFSHMYNFFSRTDSRAHIPGWPNVKYATMTSCLFSKWIKV